MCAQRLGFGFLVLGGGEGGNLCAKGVGELDAEVAESADADDADARRGAHAMVAKGAIDSDAGAEQGSDVLALERRGTGMAKRQLTRITSA